VEVNYVVGDGAGEALHIVTGAGTEGYYVLADVAVLGQNIVTSAIAKYD
jgi:hypothetical protein